MEEEVYKAKQKQLFKDRDTLRTSGRAVISFGMISTLKAILDFTVGEYKLTNILEETEDIPSNIVMAIVIVMIFLVLLVFFMFYYITGAGARKEGDSQSGGTLYLVFAALLGLLSFAGVCLSVSGFATRKFELEQLFDMIASALVDLATFYICFEIMRSGIRAKKLKQELGYQEGVDL